MIVEYKTGTLSHWFTWVKFYSSSREMNTGWHIRAVLQITQCSLPWNLANLGVTVIERHVLSSIHSSLVTSLLWGDLSWHSTQRISCLFCASTAIGIKRTDTDTDLVTDSTVLHSTAKLPSFWRDSSARSSFLTVRTFLNSMNMAGNWYGHKCSSVRASFSNATLGMNMVS